MILEHEPAPVSPGEVLAGKYRVENVLGSGGFGVVVAARHVQMGNRVALKFLLPQVLARPELVARFLREAQAATQIGSEHVARVTDVGTLESGAPYMVMEYLEGQDLSVLLHQRGPLPIPEAVDYVMQGLQALAEAHSRGIVHRDLKPANLFLTKRADGSALVKVLDFGIAKSTPLESLPQSNLTKTGGMMGSPLYMSPEQVRSAKHVDGRSDVWSLGVTIHELLTGAYPFEADTAHGVIASIIADAPRPLREKRPDAPAELEAILLGCFEKDPAKRIPNVAELARRLAPFGTRDSALSLERVSGIAGTRSSALPDAPSASAPVAAGTAKTADPWTTGEPKSSGGRGALVAVGALLAFVAVGGGAFLALRPRSDAAPGAAPAIATTTAAAATTSAIASPSAPTAEPPAVSPVDAPPAASAAPSAKAAAAAPAKPGPAGAALPKADKPAPAKPAPPGGMGGLIDDRK